MNTKIVTLLSLAFIIAIASVAVYPAAAAATQPNPLPAGVREYAPEAGTEFLSIPTVAFLSMSQDYTFERFGRMLKATGGPAKFRAPVYLPNGSYIDSVKACFFDDSAAAGTVKLYNATLADGTDISEMANVGSVTVSDYHFATDSTVSPVANNNLALTYWLELSLPASGGAGSDVYFCGVFIEYARSQNSLHAISIPGAAFDRSFEDGYNAGHTQAGGVLEHFSRPADSNPGTYLAQVSLPDGALVTKATLYYQDDNAGQAINFYLERTTLGASIDMATATSADTGYKTEDTTISNPTVDNFNCSYWAYVYLPTTNLKVWAVTIEYTLPAVEIDRLSISNAAFAASHDDYGYENHGRWLFHLDSGADSGHGTYYAPVHLPHKARIDQIWCTFYDGSTIAQGICFLSRAHLGLSTGMGEVTSSGSNGYTTALDSSISDSRLDNSEYTYFVQWVLPETSATLPPASTGVLGVKIMIDYTTFYPLFLPLVRK